MNRSNTRNFNTVNCYGNALTVLSLVSAEWIRSEWRPTHRLNELVFAGHKKSHPDKSGLVKSGAEWLRSEWRPTHRLNELVFAGHKKSHPDKSGLVKSGAEWIRTTDSRIFSPMLYQLSYSTKFWVGKSRNFFEKAKLKLKFVTGIF